MVIPLNVERLLFFCVKLCSFAQLYVFENLKSYWLLVPAPLLRRCTQLQVLSVKCFQAATGLMHYNAGNKPSGSFTIMVEAYYANQALTHGE